MYKKYAFLLFAAGLSKGVVADPEIRLLGPAFSYHASLNGARSYQNPAWLCQANVRTVDSYTAKRRPDGTFGTPASVELRAPDGAFKVSGQPVPSDQVGAYLGGVGSEVAESANSYRASALVGRVEQSLDPYTDLVRFTYKEVDCARDYEIVNRWQQNNPSFGVEYSWRREAYVDKMFASITRDSYAQAGLMVGAARLWNVGTLSSLEFNGGVTAGIWHRTTLLESNELKRVTVPFLMPALSINESTTGLGVNLAFLPEMKVLGNQLTPTSTLMWQLTYRIDKRKSGDSGVALDVQPNGKLKALFGMRF